MALLTRDVGRDDRFAPTRLQLHGDRRPYEVAAPEAAGRLSETGTGGMALGRRRSRDNFYVAGEVASAGEYEYRIATSVYNDEIRFAFSGRHHVNSYGLCDE